MPTLVLAGARDTETMTSMKHLACAVPGAAMEVIDDAGHATNVDQPTAFNSALERFLSDVASAA